MRRSRSTPHRSARHRAPPPSRRSDLATTAKYRGTKSRGAGNQVYRQSPASIQACSPHRLKESSHMVASSPKTKGYDSSMFKRGSLHLLSGVTPALFLVLSARVALAAPSAGNPAAAPAAHAPTTPTTPTTPTASAAPAAQ